MTSEEKLKIVLADLHGVIDAPWAWGVDVLGYAINLLGKIGELSEEYRNISITDLYNDSLYK